MGGDGNEPVPGGGGHYLDEMEFRRIHALPPYAFAEIDALKMSARRADVDVIDLGFGNPDIPSPAIAVEKLAEAAQNPLLKAVLTDDVGGLLPFLTTRAEAILSAARDHTAAYLSGHWPDLPRAEVLLVADTVTRLTISHLVLPGGRPDQIARDTAHLVERLLPGGTTA